ncbi:hypothetical protein ACE40V_24620, partial [Salmonella enterica]|uniref:hypothetical protein n=1 Tax=Salmonella enterica TaxID=28901 RepID=UPI003D29235D
IVWTQAPASGASLVAATVSPAIPGGGILYQPTETGAALLLGTATSQSSVHPTFTSQGILAAASW